MLARNFLTPAELKLSEKQHSALVTVLGMLERGELEHRTFMDMQQNRSNERRDAVGFNMGYWCEMTDCGTVCCIGGWASRVAQDESLFVEIMQEAEYNLKSSNPELRELFAPASIKMNYWDITPRQAADALRNYLTTGKPRWEDVVPSR